MTRAVRDRMLKDANGSISDHLRNHIHLTNCIHLKNHMHKHSPILANRAGLIRDLVVLQRSRSLRDPSTSPRSRYTPSVVDILLKSDQRDDLVHGRLSVGECGRMSEVSASKSAAGNEYGNKEMTPGYPQEGNDLVDDTVSESRGKNVSHRQDRQLKTLSDQLKDVATESDDAASSRNNRNGKKHGELEKIAQEMGGNGNGRNRLKRYQSHVVRRRRRSRASRQGVTLNEMSVASNSFGQGRAPQNYDHNVNGDPQNGCGIPWNWSRIHDSGKSFLDLAGRSLSCGLSESRLKKCGSTMDIPDVSEFSSLSTKSEREALPLLLDASGSQGSIDRSAWVHDTSGELGIFSESLLKQETSYDVASQGRSRELHKFRKHHNGRHKNLTQKYMPRTFKDLIGQNLVAQALSNAIAKRKVGLLYLFYGPHGTGKTSCARIFAKALNCQSPEHPKPCGFCNSCLAQNTGKTQNVKEIGPVGNFDFESSLKLFGNAATSRHPSQYKVLIFDACDTLASEGWKAILKVIDRAPRRVVFILVCSSLETLPHLIISRCQKFFFPKLKDADIIYTLQWISTKEDLEIDKDALKLIASRSNGSLRDAEMTLEQLSLLGKRISIDLVQELAGLISEEKLIDLLDLALSADTVNTVKNLRDIMESGVDPLALMSQLAAVITDILAGNHNFIKERSRMKFFRRQPLSKGDMEKLRQALKTLSEAEKQLRVSNDRITWLTAAVLQLAPDQQYLLPSSSAEASFNQSPLVSNNVSIGRPRKSNAEVPPKFQAGISGNTRYNTNLKVMVSQHDRHPINKVRLRGQEIDEIWLEVLERIPDNSVKEFLATEGKLIAVNYGPAPTVQLLFNSELTKSKAERIKLYIAQVFESVLQSPVVIEIRCHSRKDPGTLEASCSGENQGEIVEIVENTDTNRQNVGNSVGVMPTSPSHERNQSLSLVLSRQSLAHVIQQKEGLSEHNGWSKRKAVSIAEKLEQENLRLESRSRSLQCWNPPKATRRMHPRLKIRTRKPKGLLKFVSCGRCLVGKSPR